MFQSVWYLELPSNDVESKLQLTSFRLTRGECFSVSTVLGPVLAIKK